MSRAWLSVTEYHDTNKRLTRVRLLLRIRRGFGLNLLLWFIVAGILMAAGLHTLMLLGAIAAAAILLFIPGLLWLTRREMQKLARTAAKSAGLVEIR